MTSAIYWELPLPSFATLLQTSTINKQPLAPADIGPTQYAHTRLARRCPPMESAFG